MSGHIVKLDTSTHQTVQELLAWFVTGALTDNERVMVEAHVRTCSQCQSDLEWQRKLLAVDIETETTTDMANEMEDALARLRPQLDATRPARQRRPVFDIFQNYWRNTMQGTSWTRWALAAQFVVIVALLGAMIVPSDLTPYRLLGRPTGPATGNLVVTFKPTTSEQEMRRILLANGARIVGGPTVADAYLLSVSANETNRVLGALRTEPAVMLAESLDAGVSP